MGYLSMEYVFNVLSLQKLYAAVFLFNQISISFHEKLGFQKEKTLNNHIYRNGSFEDVILFILLAEQWEKRSIEIKEII